MKKKLAITLIMTMLTVGITACGASDNTSANDSVKDTEQVAVADTEIVETEEPAELVESTEQTSTTELVATGSVASNSSKNADTSNTSTTAATTSTNTSTQQTASNTTHEHVWVEHLATGHYEEQVVTAAYDEPVYEEKVVCGCGKNFDTVTEWADHCCDDDCIYGYTVTKVQTGAIHHDAVTQSTWVEDSAGWYECSVCGEKSILSSHNHN